MTAPAILQALLDTIRRDDAWGLVALAETHPFAPGENAGTTPLHLAARAGATACARVLLERGADPGVRDPAGATPLMKAVLSPLLVRNALLLDPEFPVGDPAELAREEERVHEEQERLAAVFLERGVELDILSAAALGRNERIRAILAAEPDAVNATILGERGETVTPLLVASTAGHVETVEILAGAGADLGAPAMSAAAAWDNLAVVEKLLDRGADPNGRDATGETPLHKAASGGYRGLAEVLLARGADPHSRDGEDRTPLHRAVAGSKLDIAALLLDHGADANADSTRHGHPMDLCDLQDIAMVQLLKGRGGYRSPFRK